MTLRIALASIIAFAACGSRTQPSATETPKAIRHVPIGAAAPAAWPDETPFGAPSQTRGPVPRHPTFVDDFVTEQANDNEETEGGGDVNTEDTDEDADLKKCPATLARCPLTGCAVPGNGKARSNEIKHGDPERQPPNTRPIAVPFEVFADLQAAADRTVGQGAYPPPERREALRSLDIRGHSIGEGAVIKVTGYLKEMRAEGPESVNCKLAKVANNDFHLSVVGHPDDDEFHGIVVEMIPQDRPKSWTTKHLHNVRDAHAQIMVVGQLFYDGKHLVNAGPVPKEGQPKRFSLWEVHPVQRFFVCVEKTACDPGSPTGWKEWL